MCGCYIMPERCGQLRQVAGKQPAQLDQDRVGLERHELAKRAKDIASAAVFMSILLTTTTWALILIPKWL